MAIRLEVKEYCADCLDFEADVTKPERTVLYGGGEAMMVQSDTVIRCKYARKCEAIKRYLEKQKEGKE